VGNKKTNLKRRNKMDSQKILGNGIRVVSVRNNIRIEELPVKGKKELRVLSCNVWDTIHRLVDSSYLVIPSNILDAIKVTNESTYEEVATKIKEYVAGALVKISEEAGKDMQYACTIGEGVVKANKIAPEGCDATVELKGVDFSLSLSWKEFRVYSPDSDFQLSDPYYSGYKQKSGMAARKLYKLSLNNNEILKDVSYNELDKFFADNKICREYIASSWG
jgi:hypothetical protein